MHYRFRGNPATNDASRLLAENKRRQAKGLRPLTMAEFTGSTSSPQANEPPTSITPPAPKPPAKPQLKLF